MRRKRRIMSGLLALCIALSALPLSACTAPKLTLDPEELYALPELPERIRGVLKCKNPRCITSVEQELPQEFLLTDPAKRVYRCIYCETEAGK